VYDDLRGEAGDLVLPLNSSGECANIENQVKEENWVAKLEAQPACYGSSLGSNPDISQKYKMSDISN
jgi:hypothetical protein